MFHFGGGGGGEEDKNQQLVQADDTHRLKRLARLHTVEEAENAEHAPLVKDHSLHETIAIKVDNESKSEIIRLHKMRLSPGTLRDLVARAQREDDDQSVRLEASQLERSDLVGGIYEGGFKVWECSLDVIRFLHAQSEREGSPFDMRRRQGMRVLDCGCGHGIPGLYCMSRGVNVDFQDYNHEVISILTIPNVLLNFDKDIAKERASFHSGDWSLLAETIPAQSYDLIVTCDTLYNSDLFAPLLRFLKHALKPDGVALIAAKSRYFGCSGSVHGFKQLVERDGSMQIKVEQKLMDGSSNVREILSLSHATE